MPSSFRCAACDAPVEVTDAEIIRSCDCDAAITADMSAGLAGAGGVVS
jgi:hypothetical protein